MEKRFCVEVLTGWTFFHGDAHAHYDVKFFDDIHDAEMFRKNVIRNGGEATKVMDLENLPF